MADSPFLKAAKWLDPKRNTKEHKRHADLVERWRALQNDLADLYEKPEDQRGGSGFDGSEAEAELLEDLQNVEAELLQLRARLRLDKILLPPPTSIPPLLRKRLNRAGDSMVFSFDVPKASRKERFRQAAGGGVISAFPVTVSWVGVPVGSAITENETVTLTGEGVFSLPGVGAVTVPALDMFGNYYVALNAPGGDIVVWIWGEQSGWYMSDSEFWTVDFTQ